MLVSTEWSTEAIAEMCALGTPVHDLFAGTPIESTCPR
ncbi:MAG: hypothetical protein QOG79_4106 [Mycobacterium sp.]|jgi:hypothetical protein|nr:hypothetical protein [Mycobacterium sp.]MDT5197796.1 hypothetical protein [Mycobacterium sp.]MDT5291084.1 hypothetical protein [Mycobacterium sp.]MDT5300864.1 hypothetical protein [Mycobacterium sp.]MDT5361075.1 hypothetical protein [Mycobacterium sp.]